MRRLIARRRTWIAALVALLVVAGVVRFGLTFPWSRTLDALASADWRLLAAAGVANICSLVAKGAAWQRLARGTTSLRPRTAQVATFAGAAVGSVSVSVSGEVVRAQLAATRDGVPFAAAIAALVLSRLVEAAGLLVVLGAAGIGLAPWPGTRPAGVVVIIVLAALFLGARRIPWHRLRGRRAGRWGDTFMRLFAGTTGRDGAGTLAVALALAVASWLAQWATYHLSIAATHTTVAPAVSLSALVVANVAGIPHLTPSNLGITQGSLILGMHLFGIAAAPALAAGLALQAVQVLPILAIGVAIVGRRGFRQLAAASSEPTT